MSDHPDDSRLEAIITLPSMVVEEMIACLEKRLAVVCQSSEQCKEGSAQYRLLGAVHTEVWEMMVELAWHRQHKKPYRYVVPLTTDEARVIDEEMNRGSDTTNR